MVAVGGALAQSSAAWAQTNAQSGASTVQASGAVDSAPGRADASQPSAAGLERPSKQPRLLRWWHMLGWMVVLLLVLVFGTAVIVSMSRRFRAFVLRRKATPTPYVDAWQMHSLPPDWDQPRDDGSDGRNLD